MASKDGDLESLEGAEVQHLHFRLLSFASASSVDFPLRCEAFFWHRSLRSPMRCASDSVIAAGPKMRFQL